MKKRSAVFDWVFINREELANQSGNRLTLNKCNHDFLKFIILKLPLDFKEAEFKKLKEAFNQNGVHNRWEVHVTRI